MTQDERSLVEDTPHAAGRYGGFCFGGRQPDGVTVHKPLPKGVIFPNGAEAAIMLTFDVEGNFGNGTGDERQEIDNYKRICGHLADNNVTATFFVLGQMADRYGSEFVEWMLEADCEVASHCYWHDMNKHYGGWKVYAGHYGPDENLQQIKKGVAALENAVPNLSVKGIRLPYGHFNEFTYDAMEQVGLSWAGNVGIEDLTDSRNGYGNSPFQMQLGEKIYPIVEIPLDSQTFDWVILRADEESNSELIKPVRIYCDSRNIQFTRNAEGAVAIWKRRIEDTVENQTIFTLTCHPINLVDKSNDGDDLVEKFLLPVIEYLRELSNERKIWVCTCSELVEVYRRETAG